MFPARLVTRASRVAMAMLCVVAMVALRASVRKGDAKIELVPTYDDVVQDLMKNRIHGHDDGDHPTTFADALKAAAPGKVVLLALVDWGFIDLALNFHESSLRRHGIDNYLLLTADDRSCALLRHEGARCFVYVRDNAGDRASDYLSDDFLRKMNYRTAMIIEALQLGYTVLHSDTDITFLQNPFHHIHCPETSSCDVRALWDATKYNAGFIYIRPTPDAIVLYKMMQALAKRDPKMDDQIQLQTALEKMDRQNYRLDIARLPEDRYVCGRCYFEDVPRAFYGDGETCDVCVVVHNNWIVTKEAKRYRAREHLHWVHDWGGYYSKPTAKYLLYSNPTDCTAYWSDADSEQRELRALENALAYGSILGRIVILPAFHCSSALCPLNAYLKIQAFDEAFEGKYREHSFLQNPKVPERITEDRSGLFLIPNNNIPGWCVDAVGRTASVLPGKPLSDAEIRDAFGSIDAAILQFHSMDGTFAGFVSAVENRRFRALVERGFVQTDYRQQKTPPQSKSRPKAKKQLTWF